jgi:hypothetical protein
LALLDFPGAKYSRRGPAQPQGHQQAEIFRIAVNNVNTVKEIKPLPSF